MMSAEQSECLFHACVSVFFLLCDRRATDDVEKNADNTENIRPNSNEHVFADEFYPQFVSIADTLHWRRQIALLAMREDRMIRSSRNSSLAAGPDVADR
jgi:hypothetical protein